SAWHLQWALFLAGAAAAVLVAAILSTGWHASSVRDLSPLAARPASGPIASLAPDVVAHGFPVARATSRRASSPKLRPAGQIQVGRGISTFDFADVIPAGPVVSQVLIDPAEAATLRRLMRGTRGGQIDPSTLHEHATTVSAIEPLTEIVLSQIGEVP